jgi:hypothetical protein
MDGWTKSCSARTKYLMRYRFETTIKIILCSLLCGTSLITCNALRENACNYQTLQILSSVLNYQENKDNPRKTNNGKLNKSNMTVENYRKHMEPAASSLC